MQRYDPQVPLLPEVTSCIAASSSPVGTRSAALALSSYRAGTRPVDLTVRLHYEMQCAWPGRDPLTTLLPAAMMVPSTISPLAVMIDGNAVTRVRGAGHRIVLDLPPRPQILCDTIAPGTLVVRFTRTARIANPNAPGVYRLQATKGSLAFVATLRIHQ